KEVGNLVFTRLGNERLALIRFFRFKMDRCFTANRNSVFLFSHYRYEYPREGASRYVRIVINRLLVTDDLGTGPRLWRRSNHARREPTYLHRPAAPTGENV